MGKKIKSPLAAAVSKCRNSLDVIHEEALDLLLVEIRKAGGTVALARNIGRSESYIRMVRIRGTNAVLRCLDEIAKVEK